MIRRKGNPEKSKKWKRNTMIAGITLMAVFCFLIWQNNFITIHHIQYHNEKVPSNFEGYQILQVSDLHNKEFGKHQSKLLSQIEKIKPDIIVVTGDLIDSKHTDVELALDFIRGAKMIAPIYYVNGNHEAWSGVYEILKAELQSLGVIVLENAKVSITKGSQKIDILGVSDPEFQTFNEYEDTNQVMYEPLKKLMESEKDFSMLLSHRPELFDMYVSNQVDLVFTGHAHGGQFRIPFIGGLVAPDQGFLPKLTEGMYSKEKTSMVVSRGLGNSIIPLRVLNNPELVLVTLKTYKEITRNGGEGSD